MIDEGAHVSKGLVAAVVFSVFVASWASAQAADFSDLVRTGSAQQVQAAIAQGADVKALDANRQSSLHVAAQYNKDPAVIAVLVKAGADPNVTVVFPRKRQADAAECLTPRTVVQRV